MRPQILGLGLILCLLPVCGCQEGGGDAASTPQSEAEEILAAADAFYRKQSGYQVSGRLQATLHDKFGSPVESFEPLLDNRTLAVRSSDEFLVSGNEFRIASNGKHIYLSPSKAEIYWRGDAFPNPLALADSQYAPLFGGPDNIVVLGLLNPGLAEALRSGDDTLAYKGQAELGGKAAHHLVIKEPMDENNPRPIRVSEVWIAAEGDPVILQLKHTPVPSALKLGGQQIDGAIVSVETFSDWQFGNELPASDFSPPAGGRRVADLGQIIYGSSPLIGKPAADVSLPLLDGTSVTLAELREQQKIVMLDFWATWCGPCREELPFVSRLAAEFANQGVVFYGVNQQETADRVRAFQSNLDYQFAAALDMSGELSSQFGARSLPYLCIIGRDGTIQCVHVGVGPHTEGAIREELTALVSGRNLAKAGLPE